MKDSTMRAHLGALLSMVGFVLAQAPEAPNSLAARVDPYVDKPRIVVMTDIANEPDDQMSMVRFLVYSNEFDVEGLIATTSTWMRRQTRPDVIRTLVDDYDQVRPSLLKHRPGFPTAEALRAVIASGQPGFGMAAVGPQQMTPGAELILRAADKNDPRPLWVLGWGGTNTLAQALLQARASRSAAELERLVAKLRVYTISDQDDAGPWLRREFPALHYIATPSTQDGEQYYFATWTGISGDRFYRNAPGADFTTFSDEWGEREHPQQRSARDALSVPVLHSRRGHAVVSRPDRQRPRERHEPELRRVGRALHLAPAVGRATRVLDARRRFVPGSRQLARHGRRRGRQ